MKIKITVFGLFHSYNLKSQLDNYNKDCYLYTSYPKIRKIRNKKNVLSTNLEYLNFIIRYFPNRIGSKQNKILRHLHYYIVSYFIDKNDVIITWGYTSKYYINKTRKLAKILILERGSAHPDFQKNILEEEYLKQGIHRAVSQDVNQLEKHEYKLSDYIVVPSNFVKKTFIDKGFKSEKIFVNPYGVNLSEFKQLKIKKNKFRIIFVGLASFQKGFQYLLMAMDLLKEKDIELWHVGNISDEIKNLDYLKPNIKYHGSKPQNELFKYYNNCDIFVLPSIQDGFGMVILQAMACGLPVICSTNTGIENILSNMGKEGFIIPIRDPNAIAERVLELYENNTLRIKMGNAAAKRVTSGFTWDDYGKRYRDFLNKIYNE